MKKNTKELILEQFLKLVSIKNIDNISTRDIAKGCEISVGTIYKHFKNKEELVEQSFIHAAEMLTCAVNFDFSNKESALVTFNQIFDYSQKNIELFYLLYLIDESNELNKETSMRIKMTYCTIYKHLKLLDMDNYVIEYFILIPFFKFCIDSYNNATGSITRDIFNEKLVELMGRKLWK